jgi:hypothetical protein
VGLFYVVTTLGKYQVPPLDAPTGRPNLAAV